MTTSEKMKNTKDWEAIEKIVFVLEKFITDDSKVEHNVKLPVTGKSNARKRQVDVLITVLNGRKRTRFMIKKKKRNSKVDINTFHGWVKKMKSIDCQHLICVSTKGFPSSVIEDVKKEYGTDTVTLMTLSDFDTLVDPETQVNIDFDIESFKWAIQNKHWEIVDFGTPTIATQTKAVGSTFQVEYTKKQELFIFGGKNYTLSGLWELILWIETDKPEIKEMLQTGAPFDFKVHFNEKDNLYVIVEEENFKITQWDFIIRVAVAPIKFNAKSRKFAYRQEIEDYTLAWICSTTLTYEQSLLNSEPEIKSIQIDFVCKLIAGKMQWKIHEHGIQNVR